jgi:hypothetical protein
MQVEEGKREALHCVLVCLFARKKKAASKAKTLVKQKTLFFIVSQSITQLEKCALNWRLVYC